MSSRPLVLPEPFCGDSSWTQCQSHFEYVAVVNEWENAAKLLWLRVRLTGRARTAYQRLTATARESYEASVKGMKDRSEPASKRELYLAEVQTRNRHTAGRRLHGHIHIQVYIQVYIQGAVITQHHSHITISTSVAAVDIDFTESCDLQLLLYVFWSGRTNFGRGNWSGPGCFGPTKENRPQPSLVPRRPREDYAKAVW